MIQKRFIHGNSIKFNFDYDRNKFNSLKSSFNENINLLSIIFIFFL